MGWLPPQLIDMVTNLMNRSQFVSW